jgi:DNA modification methylase
LGLKIEGWGKTPEYSYEDFLKRKAVVAPKMGIDISDDEINPILKPHQRDIVRWAVKGGRRAIFAKFGLGKSVMQLETIRLIIKHEGGRGLIVAPLGVRQEFKRDAEMLGFTVKFVRTLDECGPDGIYVTNYESVRDGKLDVNGFNAVSLDEASVLRSYGSKTYQTFLDIFENVRFRFVATATPSPNRHKELIHYAGYLGVMDTGQALTRFFQRNSEKANDLQLYPHKEKEFWLWLNTWAVFLQRPSDLGYSDDGYSLPEIQVHWHEVKTTEYVATFDRDGQGKMIPDKAVSLESAAREKRTSLPARIEKLKDIVLDTPDNWIIWHDLEDERRAISQAIPTSKAVYGSQDLDAREQTIIDFSDGKFQFLSAKPVIAGSGCNFQRHCHKAVFLGVGFKFNDFIQAIHRIYRFLQTKQVEIHIIYTDQETEVVKVLRRKWKEHEELTDNMSEVIKKYGLNSTEIANALTRAMGVERIEVSGNGWKSINNDCAAELRNMESNSLDLVVTSIPFSNHYEYTPNYSDFGHTESDDHFFEQMDYMTPELLRCLKPGRMACIHVKDRVMFGNTTGYGCPTINPFHAKTMFHYMQHGFVFAGMITIVTDVVRENNQTYRLGYTEMRKDGSKMGVGSPEYVLLMRKLPTDRSKAYADEKVQKEKEDYSLARWQVDAHAFWRSSGDRQITPEELATMQPSTLAKVFTDYTLHNVYDYEAHVKIGEALQARHALPSTFMSLAPGSNHEAVWHDVTRMLTLNGEQSRKAQEKHICPLQFDIVDRLIERYSAKGELVFDPFGGLMTTPYRALKLGRRGMATELNPQYFLDGVAYMQACEREVSMPSLFDLIDAENTA